MSLIPVTDVDLVVYDFDGVMTDNRVYVSQDGSEQVACNRADGLAVGMIRDLGLKQLIISTETNAVVAARARKLKLDALHGCADKRGALSDFCAREGIALSRVVYVGNDINDLEAMRAVGYPVSPSDGDPAVRKLAWTVTRAAGGAGVIRELAGEILQSSAQKHDPPPQQSSFGEVLRKELGEAVRLRQQLIDDAGALDRIGRLAEDIAASIRSGGKVVLAGNGGSFADAQHLAAEFVGRFMRERAPLPAVCLGTNSSTVTAVGNDYRFDDVFLRELRALGRAGDIFMPISTSGNSRNLIEAIHAAEELGMKIFSLLGKGGGRMGPLAPSLIVPSSHTARIQEMHITIGHMICGLVDALLLGQE